MNTVAFLQIITIGFISSGQLILADNDLSLNRSSQLFYADILFSSNHTDFADFGKKTFGTILFYQDL